MRLLDAEFDWRGADARAKAFQHSLYTTMVWNSTFAKSGGCAAALSSTYTDFDATEARRVEEWSGLPCSAGGETERRDASTGHASTPLAKANVAQPSQASATPLAETTAATLSAAPPAPPPSTARSI
jgi:hypothetical protein